MRFLIDASSKLAQNYHENKNLLCIISHSMQCSNRDEIGSMYQFFFLPLLLATVRSSKLKGVECTLFIQMLTFVIIQYGGRYIAI